MAPATSQSAERAITGGKGRRSRIVAVHRAGAVAVGIVSFTQQRTVIQGRVVNDILHTVDVLTACTMVGGVGSQGGRVDGGVGVTDVAVGTDNSRVKVSVMDFPSVLLGGHGGGIITMASLATESRSLAKNRAVSTIPVRGRAQDRRW